MYQPFCIETAVHRKHFEPDAIKILSEKKPKTRKIKVTEQLGSGNRGKQKKRGKIPLKV